MLYVSDAPSPSPPFHFIGFRLKTHEPWTVPRFRLLINLDPGGGDRARKTSPVKGEGADRCQTRGVSELT